MVPSPKRTPLLSSPPSAQRLPPRGASPRAGFQGAHVGWVSQHTCAGGLGVHALCGPVQCIALLHIQYVCACAIAPAPPLPLCQRFKIPRPVPSFLPQGQGRGRPSSQQGPPSSCLLDSSPSCGCQAPVPSVSSSVFQFQSLSLFPLASSSTCKHARASSSILKHPPFLSPLPSASQSAPLLTLPCLISQGTLHLPFAS